MTVTIDSCGIGHTFPRGEGGPPRSGGGRGMREKTNKNVTCIRPMKRVVYQRVQGLKGLYKPKDCRPHSSSVSFADSSSPGGAMCLRAQSPGVRSHQTQCRAGAVTEGNPFRDSRRNVSRQNVLVYQEIEQIWNHIPLNYPTGAAGASPRPTVANKVRTIFLFAV